MAKDPLKTVKLTKVAYLGGLPSETGSDRASILFVSSTGIGWGNFKPSKGIVNWSDVRGVSFDSGTMAKSRVGKALVFGILALAAKGTQSDTHLSVFLHDGNVVVYHAVGTPGPALRSKVQPFLTAAGVPCLDDQPAAVVPVQAELGARAAPPKPPAVASRADELAKLAALHDCGVLTDNEFASEKAKLLAP